MRRKTMNCLNYIAPFVWATSMRLFRGAGVLAGLSCCLLFSAAADAGENTSKNPSFKNLSEWVVVKSLKSGVPLRSRAPDFLGFYGQEKGKTKENEYYRILEGLQIPLFFEKIRWVKVVPIRFSGNDFEIDNDENFWAFWGKVGQDERPNFRIVDQDEINSIIDQDEINQE